jgi:RNA polymerase sigma-70 factor (ECF subfamily)
MTTTIAAEFEVHRPRLFSLAYRLLGSAEEAEDAVQDAYLRYSGADRAGIEHPAAWLAKVVTNLCLNRLTSARARRERYVGTWLPEPVVTGDGALGPPPLPEGRGWCPQESAEQRDAVSMAMLVLLERLTPTERAVYVLREAFGYGHREIAGVLDLSEANCRQVYRRAVRRVGEPQARFEPASEQQEELVASFITAAREGDLAGLEKLLAADATWWSDGGGKVTAARWPIEGGPRIAHFLAGGGPKFSVGLDFVPVEVNGATGLATWAGDTLVGLAAFEVRDGLVTGVRAVVNPEKLAFARRQLARS